MVSPRRKGIVAKALAAAIGTAALLPGVADAAVTVGADLTLTNNAGVGCNVGAARCTFVQTDPAPQYVSPLDGVIVRWRLKEDSNGGQPVNLRVARAGLAPGTFFGMGSSATEKTDAFGQSFGGPALQTFSTRLPVRTGDRIALDAVFGNIAVFHLAAGIADSARFEPVLPEGGTGVSPQASFTDRVPLVNADIEADADRDGFGDETQDQCPTNAAAQGACPVAIQAPVIQAKKKKCKKAKKKHRAAAAKKKCKKKRR